MIDKFDGQYDFLSNFYPVRIDFYGLQFNSVEAAYQSCKTGDPKISETFQNMSSMEAKRAGRRVKLRDDWEIIKVNIMYELIKQKFSIHNILTLKLIATYPHELVEGNYWKDTFWGKCDGVGQNILGEILMEIRLRRLLEIFFNEDLEQAIHYVSQIGKDSEPQEVTDERLTKLKGCTNFCSLAGGIKSLGYLQPERAKKVEEDLEKLAGHVISAISEFEGKKENLE